MANMNNRGQQAFYARSQRSSHYTDASRYSLTHDQDQANQHYPGAVGIAQPLGFQQQSPMVEQYSMYRSSPYSNSIQNKDYAASSVYTDPYQNQPVSPIESSYSTDRRSTKRKSQYSQHSQVSQLSRRSNHAGDYYHNDYAAHPMPTRIPAAYAQERGFGYANNHEDTNAYESQTFYDAGEPEEYSESDTKKSGFEEEISETTPVVPMARPQRHPHYYVPPVLRFYTLLAVFLIAVGLIGLTEYGMRRLPHAAKSENISPAHLADALRSKAVKAATSNLSKRAPQTATTQNTVVPVVSTPFLTTAKTTANPVPTVQTTQEPQVTITPPVVGTVASTSYVATTPPKVTAVASSNSDSKASSGASESSAGNALTLTSKLSTTLVTSVPSSKVTKDANGQETTVVVLIASTSTGLTAVETTVSTGKSTSENKNSIFTPLDTFVGNSYMVLIIAVAFKQFWSAIYSQSKLMEPFTQMNTEEGAPAKRIMSMFYLSSTLVPDAITAIMNGRWFILWNALVYMAVGVLAPLSSEMLFLNTKYLDCPNLVDNINNPCWPPRLTIDPVISRAVQGFLAFIAIMTINIALLVHRMRTGVYADPSSIGAVAALTHHPEVLADFRALSDEASSRDVAEFIAAKRYKLDDYMKPDGSWRYGIVPVNPTGQAGYRSIDAKPAKFDARPKSRQWKRWDLFFDIVFLLAILALLGIVAGYFVTGNDDAYNRFFSTMTFGPRFVLTGTGTLIAVNWRRLERDAHTLAPFSRMSHAPSEPLSTILLRKSSIPLTAIIPMFAKRYFLASFIAAIALLSEALVIFLGAVPYAPGQVYVELLVSAYMSMCTLGIMAIALIILMVWKNNLPDLPRAPDTLASMVTYVAESRMQEDFQLTEWFDDRELITHFSNINKRYVYGKRVGTDGEYRHLVDEEPTLLYS